MQFSNDLIHFEIWARLSEPGPESHQYFFPRGVAAIKWCGSMTLVIANIVVPWTAEFWGKNNDATHTQWKMTKVGISGRKFLGLSLDPTPSSCSVICLEYLYDVHMVKIACR
jgi:hypothetical protein